MPASPSTTAMRPRPIRQRSFEGRAQVRRNWEQIFAAVPDLEAEVRWIASEDTVWSEWEMHGTRRDGVRHLMRGVVIFGVRGNEANWARFYLEPVDQGGPGIDETVRRTVSPRESHDGLDHHPPSRPAGRPSGISERDAESEETRS